jgi:hypothetical protein
MLRTRRAANGDGVRVWPFAACSRRWRRRGQYDAERSPELILVVATVGSVVNFLGPGRCWPLGPALQKFARASSFQQALVVECR